MGVIKSPVKKYLPSPTEKDEIYERVRNDLYDVKAYFDMKLAKRRENYNFYRGNQWTPAEIDEHITQMRKPYVFNEIQNKLDHLIGSQTQTRLDAKAIPREKADEAATELLTHMVKWCEQVNNFEYTETNIFTESIIGGVGVSQIRWEKEDIQGGYPKIEKVAPEEIVWDINSKQMSLDDARWMARRMVISKMAAMEMFPEFAKEIENATLDTDMVSDDYVRNVNQDETEVEGRKHISVVEYYEKIREFKYTVFDDIRNENRAFDTQEEADAYYEGLMEQYVKGEEPLLLPDGQPRIAIVQDLVDVVYQSIIIGSEVASYEKTSLPFFPYDVMFCYFEEGDYWAYVDKLIDPQRLVNTFFSQWEYQLGAAGKNITTVVPPLVGPDGAEKVRRELSRTAPIIEVKDHSALRMWPNNPVNPELYQGIMFGIGRMMDYAGGKNALGLQENAAESGRAVIARAEQGGLARLPFFDKLRYWRINVTLKMIWYMKNFLSPGQIIRVIGADADIAYVPIDETLLNTINEVKTDIIIDEAVKSDSVKERQFMQMKELFAQIPGLPPELISKILIEFSSLPQSKKSEITGQLDSWKDYQQKQAEENKQKKMQQDVLDALTKKRMRETMEEQEQLQQAEQELAKKKKDVQTKMSDIEKARMELQNKNLTPDQMMKLQDKFTNKQELGESVGLNNQAAMLR